MQYRFLFMVLLVLTISCKEDRDCPEPDTPTKEDTPKENPPVTEILAPEIPHFEDNSNTPFADIPPEADPTVSAGYRLKKKIFFYNPAKENPGAYLVFDYDVNGNIVKESSIRFPNTLTTYKINEYKNGKLDKKSIYDGEAGNLRLGTFITYEYQNNKLVKSETKTPDGNTISYVQYDYARNRLIKVTFGGSTVSTFKYFYDSEGKVKQEESYTSTNLIHVIKFKYDNQDRVTRKEYFEKRDKLAYIIDSKYTNSEKVPAETIRLTKDEVFENKRKYSYNENGFVTELLHEDAKGLNPLERKQYQDGLIREKRTFDDHWGYAESTMTRFEYEEK